MSLYRILSIVFLVIAVGLSYYLYSSIRFDIEEEARIEGIENEVIERLKFIREAEKAYLATNGQYTSDWDKLISFIDTGRIYITERKETIITLDYGADSVVINIDTLGSVPLRDTLFSTFSQFDIQQLAFIPLSPSNKKFDIFADKVVKSGTVEVDVIEVRDTDPVNPDRREGNESPVKKPLRFGSRSDVTTAGNWE